MNRWVFALIPFCAAGVWAAEISTPTLRTVDFTGNQVVASTELVKAIPIQAGKPLREDELSFSKEAIRALYEDRGYMEVSVSTTLAFNGEGSVDVHFFLNEGPRYFIRSIEVTGNRHVSKKVLQRALGIQPGDPFSQARIFEANRQLFVTHYFNTIEITYSSQTAQQMDIHIQVKERPTQYLKSGVGYGAQTKERLSLGYENLNFLGNQRRLDVTGTFSGFLTQPYKYQNTLVETSITQPYIFNTLLEARTAISREWRKREAYHSDTSAWKSSITRKIFPPFTGELRYRFQGTRLSHIRQETLQRGALYTNVSAVGPLLTYDDTDDIFLPSIGWRVITFMEKGLTWGVGDLRFHKVENRFGRFQPVGLGFTFFGGTQVGFIRPDRPGDTIPVFERYSFGGADSVRGYSEQSLGPKDSNGDPLGGEAFAAVNLEMRHRLYKKLFGVVFLDGGQLWQRDPGASWPHIRLERLDDLRYGAGTGLRIHTPIGAMRLEFGYKLNPPAETPNAFFKRMTVHFTLGEVF